MPSQDNVSSVSKENSESNPLKEEELSLGSGSGSATGAEGSASGSTTGAEGATLRWYLTREDVKPIT